MASVEVALRDRSYTIQIGPGLLPETGTRLRGAIGRTCKAAVVTDGNVASHYAEPVAGSLREAGFEPVLATVPPGEASKSSEQLDALYDQWLDAGLDRGSVALALGGGVVGDLTGFAAASFLRGIDCVQLPTTLLAQVDSSVGGKTGINHPRGKNLIGAFHQPRLVLADTQILRTLPHRELRAGLAEVVKYGVIADAEFFVYLEQNAEAILALEDEAIARIVERSCEIKAQVVADDERETTGRRAILNFGHTLGHAIEAEAGYGVLLHGEAVAVGMAAAGELSVRLGRWDSADQKRLVALLERFGLPVKAEGLDPDAVCARTALDKKAVGGIVRFVLPARMGGVELVDDVPAELVREVAARAVQPRP